jgi:hypothetical protein
VRERLDQVSRGGDTWISFEYAGQVLGSLIGDEPATAEDREAFAASVAGQPQPSR